jgi:type III pantothenate kinase
VIGASPITSWNVAPPAKSISARRRNEHARREGGRLCRAARRCLLRLVMPRPAPNKKSDYLLIDVSNSFTKLAFASQDRLGRAERIETARLSEAALKKFVRRWPIKLIVVSSVVPTRDALIRRAAGKVPVLFVSAKCALGVGVDYPEPESIGADRLANAAAVAQLYGTPAVVVDFGTAVTFDVVAASRCYIGGVIAPGLEAMTTYLYKRTALLPKLILSEPRRAVGRSTKAAMMSGAIFGYRGLVKEILARICAEAFEGRRAQIIATGGYARLIAARLPEIDAVRPHLTLEGLRIIGNLNRESLRLKPNER